MTKPTRMALLRQYRRHAHVFAYLVLAAGVLVAVLMIQNEGDDRSTEDRVIKGQINQEAEERLSANEQQIAELERTNRVQNQILRALLAAERRDPELFGGVDLPRLTDLLDEVEPSGGGRETGTPMGSPSTGGGSQARPKPESHGDPVRPSSSSPSPSGSGNEKNTNPPSPVAPVPTPPSVPAPPVAPAPARPPAVAPILQPLVEAPVIGPIIHDVLVPPVETLDATLTSATQPLLPSHC